jgi:hypothetical protein
MDEGETKRRENFDENTPLLSGGKKLKSALKKSDTMLSSTGEPLVAWKDFWDTEKGWMQFWNPSLTWKQLTTRDRDGGLFCFDAYRALAFLWVSNSHLQEGMVIFYNNTTTWLVSNTSKAILSSASNGVTVFMVVSGFLNMMVALSISKILGVRNFIVNSVKNDYFTHYFSHFCISIYFLIYRIKIFHLKQLVHLCFVVLCI